MEIALLGMRCIYQVVVLTILMLTTISISPVFSQTNPNVIVSVTNGVCQSDGSFNLFKPSKIIMVLRWVK